MSKYSEQKVILGNCNHLEDVIIHENMEPKGSLKLVGRRSCCCKASQEYYIKLMNTHQRIWSRPSSM